MAKIHDERHLCALLQWASSKKQKAVYDDAIDQGVHLGIKAFNMLATTLVVEGRDAKIAELREEMAKRGIEPDAGFEEIVNASAQRLIDQRAAFLIRMLKNKKAAEALELLTTLFSTKQAHISHVFLFIKFLPYRRAENLLLRVLEAAGRSNLASPQLYNRVLAALIIDGNDVDADKVKVMMEIKGILPIRYINEMTNIAEVLASRRMDRLVTMLNNGFVREAQEFLDDLIERKRITQVELATVLQCFFALIMPSKIPSIGSFADVKLYVRNIPSGVTKKELAVMVQPCGYIRRIFLLKSKVSTGRMAAIIYMINEADADAAVTALNGFWPFVAQKQSVTPLLDASQCSAPLAQDCDCDVVEVPNMFAGAIIGTKGAKITELRRATMTMITFEQEQNDPRKITVCGPASGRAKAVQMIRNIVEERRKEKGNDA